MNKDILFFSNFCDYSKKCYSKAREYKLFEKMIEVCVDEEQIQLPPFLEKVPTIYLAENQSILVDDKVLEYIESKNPSADSLEGFGTLQPANMDSFSFLEGGDELDGGGNSSFASISHDFSAKQFDENSVKRRSFEDLEKERSSASMVVKKI